MMLSSKFGNKRRNIFIGNFSCEELWNTEKSMKLPVLDLRNTKAVIPHMDELFLFLANPNDIVILRNYPDRDYINQLKLLNVDLPQIVSLEVDDINKSIGELILSDKRVLYILTEFVNRNLAQNIITNLIPYGITEYEEKISKIIAARIFSTSQIASKINCKLFLKPNCIHFNLPAPESIICDGVDELQKRGIKFLHEHKCLVIKEVYGSGGSGLLVIDSVEKLNTLCEYMRNTVNGDGYIIIEKWYESTASYNHQYFISDEGIDFYCFSQQVIDNRNGRTEGSVFGKTIVCAEELCKLHYNMLYPMLKKFHGWGYRGIVGFDSLMCVEENVFFPIVDINCRINLSTIFKEILLTQFSSEYSCFISRGYLLSKPVGFKQLHTLLGHHAYSKESKEGVAILNFSALNYNILNTNSKYGEIYYAIFAKTEERMNVLRCFVMSDAMNI